MLLQDFASLKQAFGLSIVLGVFFTRQQREEIHCSYFFLFSTIRVQSLYLSEGVHCVGTDRQPQEPRQQRLPQIKMGFSGSKSLFTLKRAVQTRALRMTCLWWFFCHQPTQRLGFYDAQNCLHILTCACGCTSVIINKCVCLCASAAGFGRNVSDPAPWPQSNPDMCFHSEIFEPKWSSFTIKLSNTGKSHIQLFLSYCKINCTADKLSNECDF